MAELGSNNTEEIKIEDIIDLVDDDDNEHDKTEIEVEELEPLKDEDLEMILKENGDDSVKNDTIIKSSDATIYVASSGGASSKKEVDDDEDDDDLFEDETLAERLWGLTEMFPEPVRNATWTISTSSIGCVKGLYSFSRSAMWIIATSAIILAAPALIENEKSQLEELSRQQQRQILLGPGAGASGMAPSALTPPQPSR